MTLTVHAKMEQRSEEWYAARCGMVTASVVGTLLTPKLEVADNETSRRLTAQLVAERVTGEVEPSFVTADMWRGIEGEEHARDAYSEHYARAVNCGLMVREDEGWRLGFSPDGLVGDDGLIEIKSPRAKGHILTIITDEVPRAHTAQCQAGLLVSGRQWCDFVSFNGGLPLFVKRVFPDPEWFDAITAACVEFEKRATALVSEYEQRIVNMPPTERIDFAVVI